MTHKDIHVYVCGHIHTPRGRETDTYTKLKKKNIIFKATCLFKKEVIRTFSQDWLALDLISSVFLRAWLIIYLLCMQISL